MATYRCVTCGSPVAALRWERAGKHTCLPCGETAARSTSRRMASMCIPINKSTPTYISDPGLLAQLNPKRTA